MYIQSYKDLKVWQKSITLVEEIYNLTKSFPKTEAYDLTSQIRRCSVSIPSNIAEGYKRRSLGEYIQFLRMADASAAELETQLFICKKIDDIKDLNYSKTDNLLEEVQKMLSTMIKKLIAKR